MTKTAPSQQGARTTTRAFVNAIWTIVLASASLTSISIAQAQFVSVVGTGTAKCSQFNDAINVRAAEEREYFSWAQGYMSGILLSAPPGVDDNLVLISDNFPVAAQIAFMRTFCEKSPFLSYSSGVEALYRALGGTALR